MPRTEKRARYRRIADRGERERDDREWVIGFSHFQNGNLFFPLAPVHRVARQVRFTSEREYIYMYTYSKNKEGKEERRCKSRLVSQGSNVSVDAC